MKKSGISMKSFVKNLADDCKLLVVHGTADKVVPFSDGILFDECMREEKKTHEFFPIQNAGHKYKKKEHSKQMVNVVSEFITKNFKSKL